MADCCCIPRRTSQCRVPPAYSGKLRKSIDSVRNEELATNTPRYINGAQVEPAGRVPANGEPCSPGVSGAAPTSSACLNNENQQPSWFRGAASRETTTTQLASFPVGSFAVRVSSSRAGCLALDVRVPRFCNASGVAHFLILRTRTGFSLQGVLKEWPDLCALVTHLSIMPEMLPCPLMLADPVERTQRRSSRRPPDASVTSQPIVTSQVLSDSTQSSDSGVCG